MCRECFYFCYESDSAHTLERQRALLAVPFHCGCFFLRLVLARVGEGLLNSLGRVTTIMKTGGAGGGGRSLDKRMVFVVHLRVSNVDIAFSQSLAENSSK